MGAGPTDVLGHDLQRFQVDLRLNAAQVRAMTGYQLAIVAAARLFRNAEAVAHFATSNGGTFPPPGLTLQEFRRYVSKKSTLQATLAKMGEELCAQIVSKQMPPPPPPPPHGRDRCRPGAHA